MRDDLHIQTTTPCTSAASLTGVNAVFNKMFDISLQSTAKVLVERRATGKNDILVETTTNIDGRGLNDAIDNCRQGCQEIRGVNLRVEEDFRCKETLVANIDLDGSAIGGGDGVLQKPIGLTVVAGKFLDNIRADVTVLLLDFLCSLHAAVRLTSLTEKVLHKMSDVAASNGDGFDAASNDVALCDGDDVGDTITRVDDGTGE